MKPWKPFKSAARRPARIAARMVGAPPKETAEETDKEPDRGMSDTIFALLVDYGAAIVCIATFLSCLAVPIPTSLLMLAAGGFAASGDLTFGAVAAAAFIGAVLGDNSGYWLARCIGSRFEDWWVKNKTRANLRDRAAAILDARGGPAVFLTCWLFAPLGPSMNYVCGLTKFHWGRFAIWGMAGEVFWVTIYVGLGYFFADNLSSISSFLGNISGFLTALALVVGLGLMLRAATKKRRSGAKDDADPQEADPAPTAPTPTREGQIKPQATPSPHRP